MASRWVSATLALTMAAVVLPAAGVSAQEACLPDLEPNDDESTSAFFAGPGCVTGAAPDGDQDLILWEVPLEDAAARWVLEVEGQRGALTAVQLFPVVTEPGVEPLRAERQPIHEVAVPPDGSTTAVGDPTMLPVGRYLIGVVRGVPAGSPDVGGGDYRFDIRRETVSSRPEQEPNDRPDEGMGVAGDFAISGDLEGSADHYRWSVPEAQSWQLTLDVPLGTQARLELGTADGTALDLAIDEGSAEVLDLVLAPGDYTLEVGPRQNAPAPYLLQAVALPLEGDAEPNDEPGLATTVELEAPAWGRLVGRSDVDHFRLTVPPGPETLVDARLVWRSRAGRAICLLDEAGEDRLCRRGEGGIQLRDLALAPGEHVFEVSGIDDADDFYLLRIDPTTTTAADFESEPNDDVSVADVIDPSMGMRARGGEGDVDVFALRTSDAPQVWDIDVEGTALRQVELIQPSGRQLAAATVATDGSSARLADLQLTPGDHWLRVRSDSGDYALTATPLGPPDPDGEREPNDDEARADRYVIGDRLVGRLPLVSDRDFLRITAAGPQRVRFDLRPPDDAAVGMRLHSGGAQIATRDPGTPGAPVSWDLWLVPGDHHLELMPAQASEGFYELTSERLDPFEGVADREPNDGPAWASTVPPSLSWSGGPADARDEDWFALPLTVSDVPIVVRLEGDDIRLRAEQTIRGTAAPEAVRFERGEDGSFTSATPLAVGGRVALGISAAGPYLARAEGAGWQATPTPAVLPLELSWSLPVDAVAAYWPEAQGFDAEVTLRNTGEDDLRVELETMASHYLWSTPPVMEVSVPAGASVTARVPVAVGPDAWGTDDVQLAARARGVDGGTASATTTVAVSPEAVAVAPRTGWSVPPALLGGINVAALALGAEPAGTVDLDEERRLFDGVTPEGSTGQADQDYGNGFGVTLGNLEDGLPLELVVDLAGDEPVPVAGTILNPQASEGRLREVPREFELLLSTDGETWRPALAGTLSPLRRDQAFALDAPMAATHAMLRIHSKYVDPRTFLSLGEWKVVAEPGFEPGSERRDIADPVLGGHVVVFEPFDDDPDVARRILDAGMERDVVAVAGAHELGITLGFADDRAARIERLEWRDPSPTRAEERLEAVEVHASLDAPGGPWRFLGTWSLARGPDGSVSAFELGEPEWARYLRLRGRVPRGAEEVELPAGLSVLESPADETYRSIIGEWGYRESTGPWEAVRGDLPPTTVEDAGDDLASAKPLSAGTTTAARVAIDRDVDWYALEVPDGHDTLDIVVDGHPFVGVALTLVDAAGAPVEMPFRIATDGTVRYRAQVTAGERYAVRVEQPPFSVAFAFDTSPSIVPYIDRVTEGVRSFLSDVRPGREVANLLPFDEAPLLDEWSDDRYVLQDAFENHVAEGGSSSAEAALINASQMLAEREGARAIMLVTDAETSSYERTGELWDALTRVRPVIFSVHVGGLVEPVASRRRMQDWAQSGGGYYTYPVTAGEMDQAFERMATWLRRPAAYTLRYETLGLRPATLALVSPADGTASSALPVAPGVGVEVILDTSGSMRKRLAGKRRIEVAKGALRQLLRQTLAEGTPVALRAFGGPGKGRQANCATTQVLPLAPLVRDEALRAVKRLGAGKKTGTPIAAALDAVADDLAGVTGLRHVVLISDGAASCDGDPLASIEALRASGIEVKVDVVGFALDDEAVKADMAAWAVAGGGTYFDAGNAKALARSISTALQAPYRATAVDGSSSATGAIDGPPLELEPGTYRIEVLTEPPTYIDEVELASGTSEVLTVVLGEDGP